MIFSSRALAAILALVVLLGIVGCEDVDPTAGYTSRPLGRAGVRTVCIKMFENQTMRRGVEYQLTRALAVRLEQDGGYKVVHDCSRADTVLSGTILAATDRVLSEQRDLDRPIEQMVTLVAEVNWRDRRSGDILLDAVKVKATGSYVALLSAGFDSAAKAAANEIALRIVEQMEAPW